MITIKNRQTAVVFNTQRRGRTRWGMEWEDGTNEARELELAGILFTFLLFRWLTSQSPAPELASGGDLQNENARIEKEFFGMTEFVDDTWSDLTPIPQDEGPDPVVQIAYSDECEIFYPRPYHIIILSDLMQFRRNCIRELKCDLEAELDFMDSFAEENPKNYQIWYHRRAIVEMLGNASRELAFCQDVFEVDAKNYHAWAHRQWVLLTYGLWEGELDFVEKCIEEDIRNNSAWNHRWFVVHQGPEGVTPAILERELNYAVNSINLVKKNESSWNYLRGLARLHPELKEVVSQRVEELVNSTEGENYLALGLLADLKEEQGDVSAAQDLFETLVIVDGIRAKSWTRRLEKLQNSH
eukprot:scaffold5245_cov183-Ochromonas_danica.AAC.6